MIEALMIPKDVMTVFPETLSCYDALKILEVEGLRCAPVLDGSKTIFRGNIYRYHIYHHKFHHPDCDLTQISVTRFLKNTTKVVRNTDSLYELFFSISDLPYIAVLNLSNSFLGVVRHKTMQDFFKQSWAINEAGYALRVEAIGKHGQLSKVTRLVNRRSDITSAMTIDRGDYYNRSAILYLLPKDLNMLTFQTLLKDLERRKYSVEYWQL